MQRFPYIVAVDVPRQTDLVNELTARLDTMSGPQARAALEDELLRKAGLNEEQKRLSRAVGETLAKLDAGDIAGAEACHAGIEQQCGGWQESYPDVAHELRMEHVLATGDTAGFDAERDAYVAVHGEEQFDLFTKQRTLRIRLAGRSAAGAATHLMRGV